jgi:hypothetical protein
MSGVNDTMEEITETEYRQEMRNYYKCIILNTKCIYNNCHVCTASAAFRKGVAWEQARQIYNNCHVCTASAAFRKGVAWEQARQIYNNCHVCTASDAFRKGVAWEQTRQKWKR